MPEHPGGQPPAAQGVARAAGTGAARLIAGPRAITRRAFLRLCLAAPAPVLLLAACGGRPPGGATPAAPVAPPSSPTFAAGPTSAPVAALAPTPACADDDDATPSQTEGPYFTPNSPRRTSLLEPGMIGTKLVVSGAVLSTQCRPIARALIDVWQADDAGQYDNVGYRLRGHQFTDEAGRYRLETVVPGLYPGRTRHIHVKVQAPSRPVLTTQLYFPGEPANRSDSIFSPDLVLRIQDAAGGKLATFDFVLDLA